MEKFSRNRSVVMVGAAAVVVAGVVLWRLSRATKGADMTQSNSEKTSVPKDRITTEQAPPKLAKSDTSKSADLPYLGLSLKPRNDSIGMQVLFIEPDSPAYKTSI